MKKLDFILCGYEVDEYCSDLIDTYGENSNIIKKLDKYYDKLIKTSHIYIEQLNTIREFLIKNGYAEEVAKEDEYFIKKIKKRLQEVSKYSGLTVQEMRNRYMHKFS